MAGESGESSGPDDELVGLSEIDDAADDSEHLFDNLQPEDFEPAEPASEDVGVKKGLFSGLARRFRS